MGVKWFVYGAVALVICVIPACLSSLTMISDQDWPPFENNGVTVKVDSEVKGEVCDVTKDGNKPKVTCGKHKSVVGRWKRFTSMISKNNSVPHHLAELISKAAHQTFQFDKNITAKDFGPFLNLICQKMKDNKKSITLHITHSMAFDLFQAFDLFKAGFYTYRLCLVLKPGVEEVQVFDSMGKTAAEALPYMGKYVLNGRPDPVRTDIVRTYFVKSSKPRVRARLTGGEWLDFGKEMADFGKDSTPAGVFTISPDVIITPILFLSW
eukprot:GHVS01030659.1.p1 GENE.GHVS01030659.1~~GHVS01030659.1.p1  ORF type:complete len:266 (-),score=11.31 GHVS01030659.1:334-1131(-)